MGPGSGPGRQGIFPPSQGWWAFSMDSGLRRNDIGDGEESASLDYALSAARISFQ